MTDIIIDSDKTGILYPIHINLQCLAQYKPMTRDLFSDEENMFLYSVAFALAMTVRGGSSFNKRVFRHVLEYFTFHGIFMAPGFDLGEDSFWRLTNSYVSLSLMS